MLKRILFFLSFNILTLSGFSQNFTVRTERALSPAKTDLDISFYISNSAGSDFLGSSNFVMHLDTAALEISLGSLLTTNVTFDNNPSYDLITLGLPAGRAYFNLSVNQRFPLTLPGAANVPAAPAEAFIATVRFPIKEKCQIDSLNWTTGPFEPVGVIRDWSAPKTTTKVPTTEFFLRDSIGGTIQISLATDTICEGSSNDIAFQISGESNFDVFFSNGTDIFTLNAAGNSDPASAFTPSITGAAIYVIDSIIDINGCVETDPANFTSDTAFIDETVTPAAAGNDTTVCSQPKTIQLNGNNPLVGNGIWSQIGGPGTISFGDPTVFNTNADADQGGIYTMQWRIQSEIEGATGACPANTDNVVIEYLRRPEPAFAGIDSAICALGLPSAFPFSINLYANAIDTGIGTWSIVNAAGGSPFISTLNDESSLFTVTVPGPYTLEWKSTNLTCPADSDEVLFTIEQEPAIPLVSTTDFSQCEELANISANSISPGLGTWSSNSVNVVFGSIVAPNTTATMPSYVIDSTYTMYWEASGAFSICPVKSDSVRITRFATPDGAEVINGTSMPACGATENYTISNTNAGSTYTWILPGGFTLSSINAPDSSDVDITLADPSFAGDIIIVENTSDGCSEGVDTLAVVPTGCTFQASFTVFPNDTVCVGQPVTLVSNTAGAIPLTTEYQWDSTETGGFTNFVPFTLGADTILTTINDPGVWQIRMTASDLTIPPNPAVDDTIINITILSAPDGNLVLNSPNTICEGDTVEFEVNITGGAPPYTVNLDTGGGFISINNYTSGDAIKIFPTSNSTTYTLLSVLDGFSCSGGIVAGSFTITRNPAPIISIISANPLTICEGDSTQIRFSATGSFPFTNVWVSSIAGQENVTITINPEDVFFTPPNAGSFTYSIDSVEDSNGCFSKAPSPNISGSATITVNDGIDSASFGSSTSICFGDSTNLTAQTFGGGPGSSPYIYYFTGRSDAVQPTPFTFPDGPPTSQVYILDSVDDQFGCRVFVEDTVNLTVNPLPIATLARVDGNPVCLNDSAVFTITFTAAVGLKTVYIDNDGTPLVLSILNDTILFFPQTAVGAPTYEIDSLTDSNGCTNTGAGGTFTVNTVDAPTAAVISGGDSICNGDSDLLIVSVTGGTGPYNAYVDVFFAVPFAGLNATDSFSVTPGTTTPYTLDSVVDASGCSVAPVGQTTTTTVSPLPTAVISGSNTICEGDPTNLIFTLTPVGNTFTVTYTNGINNSTVTGLTDGGVVTISPEDDSTYTLVSVIDEITGCSALPGGLSGSATITVNPNTAPTVSIIQTPNNPVCAGDLITFTVLATDTSATPAWSWQINGGAPVSSTNSFSSAALSDGDIVKVSLDVTSAGCAVPPVVSDSVILDVQPTVNPDVNLIQIPASPVCNTDSLIFIADYFGAGANPQVRWFRNGALQVGFNDQDTIVLTPTLWNNGDSIRVRVNSVLTCPSGAFDESSLIINSTDTLTPFVEINQSPSNPVCINDLVTLNTNATGQGANPKYEWSLNGSVQPNDTLSTFSFIPTGVSSVAVQMTSSASCASTSTSIDSVLVNAIGSVTPNISFTQTPAGAICPGTNVTFNSTYTGGGSSPSVQWFVNNVLQAIGDNFTLIGGLNGDVVRVDLVSSASCATTPTASSQTTIQVQNPVEPVANIDQNPGNPVCIGDQVQFDANVTGQGNNPQYEWYYNGTLVSSSVTYTRPSVANNDQVRLVLINNDACSSIMSDTAEIIINALTSVPLIATITQSPSGDSICLGESVTFNASITGGGANPTYNWSWPLRFGGAIQNTDPSWTTSDIVSGVNFASVSITSSLSCAVPNTIQPGEFFIGTSGSITPTVQIVQNPGNPVCFGDPINFSVNSTGEGSAPIYTWFVNSIPTVTNSTGLFTYNGASDGDLVEVELTSNICSGSNTARDTIIINEQPIINPTVSIDVFPDDTICGTQFVSFAANPTGEGPNPSYEWKVGSTTVGFGPTYTGLVSGGNQVVLILTKAQPCGIGDVEAYDTVNITTVTSAAGVTINQVQPASCNGDQATFEAIVTGMSISRTYEWRLNGNLVGTGPIVNVTVSNGQNLTVDVNSPIGICGNAMSATNGITISGLVAGGAPSTSISMVPDNPICPGEDLVLSTIDTLEGSIPSYKWFVNGILEVVDDVFLTNQLVDGDTVVVEMTSSASCASPKVATDILPIKFIQTAIDTAFSDTTTFCFGDSVTFSLEDTTNVTIEWFSLISGTSLGTDYDITIFDSDSVYGLISNGRCSESTDTIIVSVFRPYSGTITASGPTTGLCFGDQVTLSVDDSTGYTHQWLYGFDSIIGETDTFLTVNYTGSFNVIVQNNVCIDTIGASNVQIAPPIDSVVSILLGDSVFCEGDSVLLGVPSVAGNALGGRLGVSFVQTSFSGISGNNPRSVEAWVRTDTSGGIAGYGTNGTGQGFLVRINDDAETPGQGNNGALKVLVGSGYITGTTSITDLTYHHIAVVFDGDSVNDIRLYVDGQLESISSIFNQVINTIPNTNLRIGTANLGFTPGIRFGGRLDEVRVWDFALDTASIRNNAMIPLSGIEPGLVGLWNFEDTTGGTAKDLAAGNDGTLENGARFINEGGFYNPTPLTFTWKEAITNTIVKGPGADFFFWADTSGQYFVEIDNDGCTQVSDTFSIREIILDPIITNTSPIDLCFGETVILNSINTTSQLDSIQWLYAGNAFITNNDSSLVVNASGSYSVAYFDNGCSDTSNAVIVNIAAEIDTTLTIDGDTALCDGDTTFLSVPLYGGNNVRLTDVNDDVRNIGNPSDFAFINRTGRFTIQYWHQLDKPTETPKINAAVGNAFASIPGFFAGYQRGPAPGLPLLMNETQIKVHLDPDGANEFLFHSNGPSLIISPTDTGWHQVTITVDSSVARIYFDGNEVSSSGVIGGTADYSSAIDPFTRVFIGDANSSVPGSDFSTEGAVDEVRIWNIPLDSATIANNWYRPLNGDEPGLFALFNLDEDTSLTAGDIVTDLTVNGFTGQLFGSTKISNSTSSMSSDSLTYQWYNGATAITGATSNVLAVDTSGSFYAVISTANGLCVDTSRTVIIKKFSIDPAISVLNNDTVCFGDSVQLEALNLIPPGNIDSVNWYLGSTLVSTNPNFNPSLNGNYNLEIFNGPCSADTSQNVVILAELNTDGIVYQDTVLCEGESIQLIASEYGGGSFKKESNNENILNVGSTSNYSFINETGTATFEFWAKIDAPSNQFPNRFQTIISNSTTSTNKGFSLSILTNQTTGGFLNLRIFTGSNTATYQSNAILGPGNTAWNHYAVVIDSGFVSYYRNGVLFDTDVIAPNFSTSPGASAATATIGGIGTQTLLGSIDEIRIWKTALNSQSIANNYQRPINDVDPLIATIFNFDVDTASRAGDLISNVEGTQSGTLTGASARIVADNPFRAFGNWTYQWYRDGAALTGATSNTLTVDSALVTGIGDSSEFFVAINNSLNCGPDSASPVIIKINRISDSLFFENNNYCFGTDSTKIWVQLDLYDSVEIYNLQNIPLAVLSDPSDTFYISNSDTIYGIVYNTIDGKFCSKTTDTLIITVFENPTVKFAQDSLVICIGDSDSLFSLLRQDSVFGGFGTYTYNWSPGDSLNGADSALLQPVYTANFDGEINFILTVTDTNGCFGEDSIRVITYPRVVPDLGPDMVNICFGDTLGLGDSLMVTGGKPGTQFQYLWDTDTLFLVAGLDSVANPQIVGSTPGLFTYILQVTDSITGCVGYDSIKVFVNDSISINAFTDSLICFDTDTIRLGGAPTADGGTGTITYTWNPSTNLSDASVSSPYFLNPGIANLYTYFLTVTDSLGCSKTSDSINITVAPQINVDAGADTVICFGDTSVLIGGTPTANGGFNTFGYQWTSLTPLIPISILNDPTIANPTVIYNSPVANDSAIFVVTVFDTAASPNVTLCEVYDTVVVYFNREIIVNGGVTNAICFSDTTQLSGQAIGGSTNTFIYAWSGNVNTTILNLNDSASLIIGTIGDGTDSLILTAVDINFPQCSNTDTLIFSVNDTVNVNAGIDTILCFQQSLELGGLIPNTFDTTASGGSGNGFSYLWTGIGGTSTFFLTNPNIKNPLFNQAASNDTLFTYQVEVTDLSPLSCNEFDTISITVNPKILIDPNVSDSLCIGDTLVLGGSPTASQGSGGFSYQWFSNLGNSIVNTSDANPLFVSIMHGIDSVKIVVTDNRSCRDSASITIEVDSLPKISFLPITDFYICRGDDTTIVASATSGNQQPNSNLLTFNWNNGVFNNNSINVQPNVDSIYIVTVINNVNGCSNRDTINLEVKPLPNNAIREGITILGDTLRTCSTPNLLALQIVNDSSTTATSFWELIDPPGPTTIPSVSTSSITIFKNQLNVLGNTISNVTTDIFGCVNYDTLYITTNNLPNAVLNVSDSVLCFGDSITLSVTGVPTFPTPAFSFVRVRPIPGAITSNPFDSVVSFVIGANPPPVTTWVSSDTFEFEVLINTGCQVSLIRDVIVNPNPDLQLVAPDSICFGEEILLSLNNQNPTPQAPLENFTWNLSAADTSQVLLTGFSDTIIFVIVSDTNGCTSSLTDTIFNKPLPDVTLDTFGTISICEGNTFDISVLNPGANYTYQWKDSSSIPTVVIPTATSSLITIDTSGQFFVVVTTDGLACTDSSIAVTVIDNPLPTISLDTVPFTAEFCFGSSVTLSENGTHVAPVTYQWDDLVSGTLANVTNTLTISDSGNFVVIVTDGNGCIDTSAVQSFFELPLSTDSIIGDDTVCAQSSSTYTVSTGNIGNWRLNQTFGTIQGANLVSGFWVTTSPVSTVTVNWNGANTANLYFTPDNSVSDCPVEDTFAVTVVANPVASIQGPTSGCFGDNLTLFALNSGDTYSWTILQANFGILTNNNDTTNLALNQPVVSANGFDTSSIRLIQTDLATGCVDTALLQITKYQFASAEWRPAGFDSLVCVGDSQVYSIQTPVPGATYTYFVSGGNFTQLSNQSFSVVWFVNGVGSIRVIADNGNCADTVTQIFDSRPAPSNSVSYLINGIPQANLPTSICISDSFATFRVNQPLIGLSDTVIWSVLGNASIFAGGIDTNFVTLQLNGPGQFVLDYVQENPNGCAYTEQITVGIDVIPTLDIIIDDTIVCENAGLSVYNLTSTNITGSSTVSFAYSDPGMLANGFVPNQQININWGAPGTNKYLAIEYTNGACVANDTFFISVEELPNAFITPILDVGQTDTVFCENLRTIFFANPADTNYTYQWYINGNPITDSDTSRILVDESGNYSFSVETLAEGCRDSVTTGVVATLLGGPDAEINASDTFWCGAADTITLTSVNTATNYKWYINEISLANLIALDVRSTRISSPDSFFVVLINGGLGENGCTDTSEAVVIEALAPAISLFAFDSLDDFCNNEVVTLNGNNIGRFLTYEWTTTGQGNISDPFTDSTFYTPSDLDSGLVAFEFVVTNFCGSDISNDTASFRLSPDATYTPSALVAELNELVTFTPNDESAIIYEWVYQPGAGSTGDIGSHRYSQAGDYLSFLIATNEFNCSDSFAVPIHVTRNQLIYVPNVFSPNAMNAENKVMKVYGTNISSFEIIIFNRWGTKVFESNDIVAMKTSGWDGTNNSGAELPSGVYTYSIKGKFFDGEDFQQAGTVSLIK